MLVNNNQMTVVISLINLAVSKKAKERPYKDNSKKKSKYITFDQRLLCTNPSLNIYWAQCKENDTRNNTGNSLFFLF